MRSSAFAGGTGRVARVGGVMLLIVGRELGEGDGSIACEVVHVGNYMLLKGD